MRFDSLLPQIRDLPLIKKSNLKVIQDKSDFAFDANIKRWLKKKVLIKLKNGYYVTKDYVDRELDKGAYNEFVAGQLIFPSYLSREYVLQKHNVLTETTFGYTLVTTKKTKHVQNDLSYYSYSFIKPDLFCGYFEKKYRQHSIFMATKAKALFDFLYFKKRLLKDVNRQTVAELRLDLDDFADDDFTEFEKYLSLARSPKMNRIYTLLKGA
ncbi:MAG: hypothetical protein GY866_32485 [Proteobacteria bacterium]|nr:hypothetical protein [Pseudomonadota bacterium]